MLSLSLRVRVTELLILHLDNTLRQYCLLIVYIHISRMGMLNLSTMKSIIFEKTGFLPSITENGTHYVANMRLSLELLKELCESQEGIVRITGDYTGGISGR
jgi:hypothetical protein